MKEIYAKLHAVEIEKVMNGGRPTLTAKQFLGKEGSHVYYDATSFLTYAKSLRPNELTDLSQVMTFMNEGLRFTGSLAPRQDKGGRRYVWCSANRTNSTTGAKLILEKGTTKFLEDYVNGKFVVGFTLEELIEEAMND